MTTKAANKLATKCDKENGSDVIRDASVNENEQASLFRLHFGGLFFISPLISCLPSVPLLLALACGPKNVSSEMRKMEEKPWRKAHEN